MGLLFICADLLKNLRFSWMRSLAELGMISLVWFWSCRWESCFCSSWTCWGWDIESFVFARQGVAMNTMRINSYNKAILPQWKRAEILLIRNLVIRLWKPVVCPSGKHTARYNSNNGTETKLLLGIGSSFWWPRSTPLLLQQVCSRRVDLCGSKVWENRGSEDATRDLPQLRAWEPFGGSKLAN